MIADGSYFKISVKLLYSTYIVLRHLLLAMLAIGLIHKVLIAC